MHPDFIWLGFIMVLQKGPLATKAGQYLILPAIESY